MRKLLLAGSMFAACMAPSIAHAEPISTAIGLTALITGLGASAAVAGAIGGAIVSGVVSVGLNLLANTFAAKPASDLPQTPVGVQSQLQVGAAIARNMVLGKQWTAGTLAYWNIWGDNNEFLQLVFTLAAGPHDLFGVNVNGSLRALGALEAAGYRVTDFDDAGHGCMWVKFFNGTYDQLADPELVTNAQPAGRWTSSNRGRGVCYVVVTLFYAPQVYPQGIPQFLFQLGARLYDIREDSTAGGSGAQRWSDQSTWTWSDNAAVGAYVYGRGLYINGIKQLGRGLAPVDLLADYYIAAANICDEVVTRKDGGTEPRYRIGMNVGAERAYSQVEQDICTAMGGAMFESAGAFGPIAGVAQSIVFTFTTKDLILGKPRMFAQKRSRSELVNAIYGTWGDPDQNGQSVPYPARRSATDETADGGEFALERDYPMIPSLNQVQRVGEIERRLSRTQATASLTLGFPFSPAEQGDWVTWSDSPVGSLTFQVLQYTHDDANNTTLQLREINSDVYAFDPEVYELDPLAPGDLPGIGELLATVPSLSAEAVQLTGADGLQHPGIRCLWSPILDRTVDRVRVQYRLVAQPADISDGGPFPPEDGEGILSAGIQAATDYEVRATIDTTPVRLTTWTDWTPVTAAALHVVPKAKVADSVLALAAQYQALIRGFNDRFNNIEDFIGRLQGERGAQDFLGADETSRQAVARDDTLRADFTTGLTDAHALIDVNAQAVASLSGSFAEYQITVAASFNGLSSSVTETSIAVAGVENRLTAFWGLVVNSNGVISSIELASDGHQGLMRFQGDQFKFAINGQPDKGLVFGTINGQLTLGWGGDMYLDGTLQARMVGTNLLIADQANIKDLTVNTIHLRDSSVTVPVPFHATARYFVAGFNTFTTASQASAVIVSTPGSPVVSDCKGWFDWQVTGGSAISWAVQLNGNTIDSGVVTDPGGGGGGTGRQHFSGTWTFTASGGGDLVTIALLIASANTNDSVLARDGVAIVLKK